MGEALLAGQLGAQWASGRDIMVGEPIEARRQDLASLVVDVDVPAEPMGCHGALIAVKPNDVEVACRALASAGVGEVRPIAAGVPRAGLERWLGAGARVVRAMLKTPALVGAGAAAIAPGTWAGDSD